MKVKIPVRQATIEAILCDISYWEDPKATIVIAPSNKEGNKFYATDHSRDSGVMGSSIKDALINLQMARWRGTKVHDWEIDDKNLDWSGIVQELKDE